MGAEAGRKLKTIPILLDVNSDQQVHGLQPPILIDRDTAARLGVNPQTIDRRSIRCVWTRQVSTMYTGINQYHVVLEVLPQFQKAPTSLNDLYVQAANGTTVPISTFTHIPHDADVSYGESPGAVSRHHSVLCSSARRGVVRRRWTPCRAPKARSGCPIMCTEALQERRKYFRFRWPVNPS